MAVAVRVFVQIVLVIFLRGEEVDERPDLHRKSRRTRALNRGDSFDHGLRFRVRIIHASLILRADIVPLTVDRRGVDDLKVRKQQLIQAHASGIVGDLHRLAKARLAGAYGFIICVLFSGSVGIAAFGIQHAGDGLHELFHTPEATAREIDDAFFILFHSMISFVRKLAYNLDVSMRRGFCRETRSHKTKHAKPQEKARTSGRMRIIVRPFPVSFFGTRVRAAEPQTRRARACTEALSRYRSARSSPRPG